MAWIHVTIAHGPGRMSVEHRYEYVESGAKKYLDDLHESLKEEFPSDWEYGPSVITMKKVRVLPEETYRRLMARHQGRIRASQAMLTVLASTKTATPRKKR